MLKSSPKKEDEKSCGNDCWVCPMLIVRLTHRPFMRLCGGWPLPSSASHPHPRGSHSARVWLGGSWSSFVVGNLRGGCQGCNCVALYFPREEKEGEKIAREGKWEMGGVPKKSLDTDCLVNQHPERGRGWEGEETGKRRSKRENELRRKTKNPPLLRHPTSSCSSLSFPLLLPILSLHLSMCKLTLQFNNKLLPSPSSSSNPSHPLPLLYTHSIIWETRLRAMSGVRAIIIITSFCYTVNYSPPYRKQTFKS